MAGSLGKWGYAAKAIQFSPRIRLGFTIFTLKLWLHRAIERDPVSAENKTIIPVTKRAHSPLSPKLAPALLPTLRQTPFYTRPAPIRHLRASASPGC